MNTGLAQLSKGGSLTTWNRTLRAEAETGSSPIADTLWREREEEDACEGWAGLRGGLLRRRRRASQGGPDPSAQSHQNLSWWVLKSIRKCQGPGKGNVTLEKTGRVGLEPPEARLPAKPQTLGWQGCSRGGTWAMSRRDSTTRSPNTRPMDCGQRLQGNRIRK